MNAPARVCAVVMAKYPRPGRVKTRLVSAGLLDEAGAARFAWALLRCTVDRLASRTSVTVALACDDADRFDERVAEVRERLGRSDLAVVEQGSGDLGSRLDRVWRDDRFASTPVAFFGTDSPDVPAALLAAIPGALVEAEIAVGPTADGGYWTLAGRRHQPEVLDRIDWGTESVYDQTRRRARDAGLTVSTLPPWYDVDRPEDVEDLCRRLSNRDDTDQALVDLARHLEVLPSDRQRSRP
ncbi:MAG: glycosyltransferase [Planctomycetes bacterium]|nr:glycosyltransferase [Planctomycetota bacterium]